jgi:hypothetical protein
VDARAPVLSSQASNVARLSLVDFEYGSRYATYPIKSSYFVHLIICMHTDVLKDDHHRFDNENGPGVGCGNAPCDRSRLDDRFVCEESRGALPLSVDSG